MTPVLRLECLLPELVLLGSALVLIAADLLLPASRRAPLLGGLAVFGTLAAFALVLATPEGVALEVLGRARIGEGYREGVRLTGWISDDFSLFCRGVVAGGGVLLVLLSLPWTRRMDRGQGEYYAILLFALLGVMLCAGVMDLLSLFVCLELVTILAYVLAAFRRNDLASTEAGLKMLVIGAVSTALLLLGVGLVYGHTGSLSLEVLSQTLAAEGSRGPLLPLGLGLLLAGLLFKIGGVPFHVWVPDVYQGAPSPTTAFLATASKAAGLILLLRVATAGLIPGGFAWIPVLVAIGVATLVFGTLGAIAQRNLKRMIAYSSIGHAGYLLLGLVAMLGSAVGPEEGATAILYYLLTYVVTTLTAFGVIAVVSPAGHGAAAYRGLWQRAPLLALGLGLALLSLAGVPPMGGFFAKFLVLNALAAQGMYVLAFLGALLVIVSLYFYFLWLKELYFRAPEAGAMPVVAPGATRVVLAVGMAGMLALGLFMGPFYSWAEAAARALLATR